MRPSRLNPVAIGAPAICDGTWPETRSFTAGREAEQQPELLRRKGLCPARARREAGCNGRPDQRSTMQTQLLLRLPGG
jgi:hypothetical protein